MATTFTNALNLSGSAMSIAYENRFLGENFGNYSRVKRITFNGIIDSRFSATPFSGVKESLTSILHQTYSEWELIIGINGHPPNSEVYKKAKKYENDKIKVIDLFEIKGKSGALNTMLNHCQYDWISLLDVDDIWKPTKLESQLKMAMIHGSQWLTNLFTQI